MRERGFNLIELLVVLAIAGIALAIAVPNLQSQIVSARTRAVAESIQSGLLLARSEAIKRNGMMRFQLVSTMDASCAASATSRLWVVTQYTAATTPANTRGQPWSLCHVNAYSPPDQEEPCPASPAYSGNATSCVTDPFIAYQSGTETAASVDVSASPATTGAIAGLLVTFGPMGQLLGNYDGSSTQAATTATVSVGPSSGVAGRRYQVLVRANGGVRLCNPDAAVTDAMAC
ncbi:MAG: prepilin-type N-terminal cleavage/methylation domain-containing protein [Rhodocyclales bacterium]|nr:prepilin-type N-terminal cleavage/methylation domain-containing protein [Rhodocyclales bacterium]